MVTLAVSMKVNTADGPRTRYVTEKQAWQRQGDKWRIVVAAHSDVVKMPPALHPNPNLYNKDANANVEIEEAVAKAKKDHQRVIPSFGGTGATTVTCSTRHFIRRMSLPYWKKIFRLRM